MATPAYIIPANVYTNSSVDDVQDILDNLDTLLAANGWTVTAPGGPYRTPNDPWGRWFRLTFTRVSATRLQCSMTDDQARTTTTREMQITGTQQVNYYYGTRYLYIENYSQADEIIYASLLSLNPESETSHDKYCVFYGSRNSAGTKTAYLVGTLEQIGSAGSYVAQADYTFLVFGAVWSASPISSNFRHLSGARRWFPVWVAGNDGPTAADWYYRGKLYNALVGSPLACTPTSVYTVPLDEATTGSFRVLRMSASAAQGQLLAVRTG